MSRAARPRAWEHYVVAIICSVEAWNVAWSQEPCQQLGNRYMMSPWCCEHETEPYWQPKSKRRSDAGHKLSEHVYVPKTALPFWVQWQAIILQKSYELMQTNYCDNHNKWRKPCCTSVYVIRGQEQWTTVRWPEEMVRLNVKKPNLVYFGNRI